MNEDPEVEIDDEDEDDEDSEYPLFGDVRNLDGTRPKVPSLSELLASLDADDDVPRRIYPLMNDVVTPDGKPHRGMSFLEQFPDDEAEEEESPE